MRRTLTHAATRLGLIALTLSAMACVPAPEAGSDERAAAAELNLGDPAQPSVSVAFTFMMVAGTDPACILATWHPLPGLIFYVSDSDREYRLESDARGAAFFSAASGSYGLRVPGMDVYQEVETRPTESFGVYPSPEGRGRVLGLYALSGGACPE